MIHATCDPDVTRPEYFVTSPSRDSNDSDGSVQSIVSPAYTSPMDSPLHSSVNSSAGSNSGTFRAWKQRNGKAYYWSEFSPIDEQEEEDRDYEREMRRNEGFTRCLMGILGLVSVVTVFCFIIWGASRPYSPQVDVKSLILNNFDFGQGSDYTGVPTKLLTVNCSVEMIIYNPASFFGVHVSSTSVELLYSEITVASGQLGKYYQPRKSRRVVNVQVEGNQVPLYGAGTSLRVSANNGRVPLKLEFDIRSQADVAGKLVRTKHRWYISCSLIVDSSLTTSTIQFKKNSCTYD